jgi:poly(A) polymerase
MDLQSDNKAAALHVISSLRAAGHTAYFAGGCVRDFLLGRAPKDYDVATAARPEQVRALFERTEAVGAAFGVVLVLEQGQAVEVATFRDDGAYSDGRRPDEVRYTTPERDAQRRDFTVNGMFQDPESGQVLDFVGGSADLDARLLRAIGEPERRFQEDRLRVLRAVRFAAELGFELEPRTAAAMKAYAPQLQGLAWERVSAELSRLLLCPGRAGGMSLLMELGLAQALLPELLPLVGCAQPPQFHPEGDVWAHTLLALGALVDPSPALAWATLLHDIGKPACFSHEPGDRIRFNRHEAVGAVMAEALCRRLRLGQELSGGICTLVRDHLLVGHADRLCESKLKRLLRRPDLSELLELHRVDCTASHGDLSMQGFCKAKLAEFEAQGREASLLPKPLLTGHDLIGMGLKPGPKFGEILEGLEDEQLEGRIQDRETALAWAERAMEGTEKPSPNG